MTALGWAVFGAGIVMLWIVLTGRPLLATLQSVVRGEPVPARAGA